MAGIRYRTRKTKKTVGIVQTKIVRVDDRTQIEVPIHISDAVAIERFLLRRKIGPRPPLIVAKADEEELLIPEDIIEPEEEEENEEGDI